MNDLMLKMKTVANMENDMERWLQDRDRISKQLEGCQKKRDEAVRMKRVRINYYLLAILSCVFFLFCVVPVKARFSKMPVRIGSFAFCN